MSEPPSDHVSMNDASRRTADRRIRNRALTIGVSVTPFGLSFGAVSVEAHLSLVQVCLLSLVLFSGASQFALVSIIGAGGSYFSAVGTALLLGVRNGLYAARINALLRPTGWRRFVMAEVTIDESTAMAVSESRSGHSGRAFWFTALSVYVLWNVSTVVGALVGNALGSPATTGLNVAGPAAFIALLAPRLTSARIRMIALGIRSHRAGHRPCRSHRRADSHRRPDGGRASPGGRPMKLWLAVLIACAGCAVLKLAGFVVPSRLLESSVARRILDALPVTLLSALIAVSVFATGNHLTLDSRAAGLAVALILVAIRAPFLVVVVAACATAAGVHAL